MLICREEGNPHLGKTAPDASAPLSFFLHQFLFCTSVLHQPSRYLSPIRSVLTAADAIPCTPLNSRGKWCHYSQLTMPCNSVNTLTLGGGVVQRGLLRCRKICATLYSLTLRSPVGIWIITPNPLQHPLGPVIKLYGQIFTNLTPTTIVLRS